MSDNDKMREAFEKWALSNDGPSVSVTRNDVGRYEDEELNMAWLGWQAAQAERVLAPSCRECANRGRVNGLSQESYCDSCVWQGQSFRVNHYAAAIAAEEEPRHE